MHTFKVTDMSCAHCVSRIENELKQLPNETKVDLSSHTVSVNGDEQVVNQAKELVSKLGYTVE